MWFWCAVQQLKTKIRQHAFVMHAVLGLMLTIWYDLFMTCCLQKHFTSLWPLLIQTLADVLCHHHHMCKSELHLSNSLSNSSTGTLLAEVTSSLLLPAFKTQLKTVLFERSFPDSSGRIWHFVYMCCHLRCSHVLSVFLQFFFFVKCPSSHWHCATLICSFNKWINK